MKKKICIVIPFHREKPNVNEQNSLKRCLELYEGVHDIFLVGPEGINISNYQSFSEKLRFIPFPRRNFVSEGAYNYLLIKPGFYKPFMDYEYMFLYQLDAFIFHDSLLEMCSWDYDYIGAPWLANQWKLDMDKKMHTKFFSWFFTQVGNGGFSLRKIKKAYWIAVITSPLRIFWRKKWHEDLFWSTLCHRFIPGYKLAPLDKALLFSIEDKPEEGIELNNGKLPFGCHAWEKNNPQFWIPHFEKLGYRMTI